MATDARGHTVPAATDVPSRNTLLNMALSINDAIVTANTTTRAALATALSPTTSRPLLVFRTDAARFEYTSDGTNWSTVAAGTDWTSSAPVFAGGVTPGNGVGVQSYKVTQKSVEVHGSFTLGTTSAFTASVVLQLPPVVIASGYVIHASAGSACFYDNSAALPYPLTAQVVSLTTGGFGSVAFAVPGGGVVNATLPVAFGTSDVLSWQYTYEAA